MPSMEQLVEDLRAKNKMLADRLQKKTDEEMPEVHRVAQKMSAENDKLLARIALLEAEAANAASAKASPSSEAETSPSSEAETSPAPSPKAASAAAITPLRRRSPRKKSRKRKSYFAGGDAPPNRRLSSELRSAAKNRTPKPVVAQELRKTLGEILHLNMDAKIVGGHYHDSNNIFQVERFEDDTRSMVTYVLNSEDIDTTGFDEFTIFKLACSVAKKREANCRDSNSKKKRKVKKNKTRQRQQKVQKL